MEQQRSKQRTGRPYAYRRAERGQSLVFIALVLAFLTPFIFTVIEFSERQMEVAQMEDALQQSIRSAVQAFDYAHLARNGQRIDQQRALQTARETFVRNLSTVSGLVERPEALAERVTWRVLPEGGTCSFSDGQAQTFGVPVRDVQEFLADIGLSLQPPEYRMAVTYQDACHLAHGQRIREQPRTLLTSIPGLTLIEMENADWCCGSAGTYNLEHPAAARALLNEKVEAIARTGADVVAAANPGCLMQLSAGVQAAQLPIRVRHPMAILAAAYRRESPQHPRDSYV